MNVLIINLMLYTADKGVVPRVKTIKDTMVYNLCLGFKSIGHSVTLAAADIYKPTEIENYEFEIKWFGTILTSGNTIPQLRKIGIAFPVSFGLYGFLKKNHKYYDLVVTSEAISFSSLIVSRLCPKKTVVWHEVALHPRMLHKVPSRMWYNLIVRFLMRKPLFVARSESAREFVRRYHKHTAKECVEHGVELNRFRDEKEKENFFLVVSQLIARKNISSIIRSFANLVAKEEYRDYKLYIIGRGEQEQSLRDLCKEFQIERNVFFTGFLQHEEMRAYVEKAKALLINTMQDNNMVSIPESIVCGTPILTNEVPTNAYVIRNNQLGIVKSGWGEEELEEIIKNSDQYVMNCINYRENLSRECCAKNLIELYQENQVNA